MRSGPGPEATVGVLPAQLGMCLTEMGPLYDWPNESVILYVENAALNRFWFAAAGRKPLARASVRRDHELTVKFQ